MFIGVAFAAAREYRQKHSPASALTFGEWREAIGGYVVAIPGIVGAVCGLLQSSVDGAAAAAGGEACIVRNLALAALAGATGLAWKPKDSTRPVLPVG